MWAGILGVSNVPFAICSTVLSIVTGVGVLLAAGV